MASITVFIIVTLLLIQTTFAEPLSCYECTSPLRINSDCEFLNFIPPKACEPEQVCARYVLKVSDIIEILHRKCASEDVCAQLQNNTTAAVKECQVCDQNECNSG